MKQFVTRITLFAGLAFLLLAVALFILPNPLVKHNMLGALLDKHAMLARATVTPPVISRIIIIGGSNVAYGIDSKRIEDALHVPVVNAGLHASLGMKFYITDIRRYVREGDVVLVIPEYSQYYTESFYGNMELVSILFDVYPDGMKNIDKNQWWHLMRFIPFYAASKLKLSKEPGAGGPIGVYDRKAFNGNGDAYVHWTKAGLKFEAAQKAKDEDQLNGESIKLLVDFQKFLEGKKAIMLLLPPAYQSTSFVNQKPVIDKIFEALKQNHLPIVASPQRYVLPDSVFYDTNYHLILPGIEQRSKLLIEDLKRILPVKASQI